MLASNLAINTGKEAISAGQTINDTVNTINKLDSLTENLLNEGESDMPGLDEITYETKKKTLTENIMIELMSPSSPAKELLRPSTTTEKQALVTRLFFSCCCPPKELHQLRISQTALIEAMSAERDPVFQNALKDFCRVTTGMGKEISQAAWATQAIIALLAQIHKETPQKNVQALAKLLSAIIDQIQTYHQGPSLNSCLPRIEKQEIERLLEACHAHQQVFTSFANRSPEFEWSVHYQQLSGLLNSMSKEIKEHITRLVLKQPIKIINSVIYADWEKNLLKQDAPKSLVKAMMMSLDQHNMFVELIRNNREPLTQVNEINEKGILFFTETIHHLTQFLLSCCNTWDEISRQYPSIDTSLWWLNLIIDMVSAMISAIDYSRLSNTPFSRALLDNTIKRLQFFRRTNQQHATMQYLTPAIELIAKILGHNDKQFDPTNPIIIAISRVLYHVHNRQTIALVTDDLRQIIRFAFKKGYADKSHHYEYKVQFRLYALAHHVTTLSYVPSKIKSSELADQVSQFIAAAQYQLNTINEKAMHNPEDPAINYHKKQFQEQFNTLKLTIQTAIRQSNRTPKINGYTYPFIITLLRWGLAYTKISNHQDEDRNPELRADNLLPPSLSDAKLLQYSPSVFEKAKGADMPLIKREDIVISMDAITSYHQQL